jgi:thiamine biosynthesis lipoprotein
MTATRLPGHWTSVEYPVAGIAIAERDAIGTSVRIAVADPGAIGEAADLVDTVLTQLDQAASRFRPDSDLERLNALAGHGVVVGPRLNGLVATALGCARWTGGLVDPTVGAAVIAAGYDRDFAALDDGLSQPASPPRPSAGWRAVRLAGDLLELPAGTRLDLGATGKAFGADRAATVVATATGVGVLVSFGGDLAVSGPPAFAGGWPIEIEEAAASAPTLPVPQLRLLSGGLATSSTTKRRWTTASGPAHHLIDPRTGAPAFGRLRTASVAAATSTEANAASTAVLVGGDEGLAWLIGTGLPARLVADSGEVITVGGWPDADGSPIPTAPRRFVDEVASVSAWGPRA